MLVDIPVNRTLMLVGVGEIMLTLVLPQLFADLLLAIRGKVKSRKRIGKLVYLAVGQVFEDIQQVTTGLGQQIRFVRGKCGMQ